MIGISYRSASAHLAPYVAAVVNQGNDVPIIAGGIGATSDPDDALKWANAVCIGEGDRAIGRLLSGMALDLIPNVRPRYRDRAVYKEPLLADLDEAPFPDYDPATTWSIVRDELIENDGRLDNDKGCYPLLTSRGCPRACTYCHNSTVHKLYAGQVYARQRSVDNVLAEIAWAQERFHFTALSIYDDLFIMDPDWVFEYARKVKDVWRGPFWIMTHPVYIREDVIAALMEVGLEEVCLGVQSGSDRILKLYKRGTSRAQILEAAAILARLKIKVKVDIISANPLETEGDRLDTMELMQTIARLGLPGQFYPGLSRLTIFPGSEIGKQITQEDCFAVHGEYQDFVDGLYRAAFVERWRDLDLVDAMGRYDHFDAWCAARTWPEDKGVLSDEHWTPHTSWLDNGAPKGD